VISDIVGISGRRMIEAPIAGRTDPQALAELADGRLKATRRNWRRRCVAG
jgi:transposase